MSEYDGTWVPLEWDSMDDAVPVEDPRDIGYDAPLTKIREVMTLLSYEEVGTFPFRRLPSGSGSIADVEHYYLAWARKGSGVLVTADTWQWRGGEMKANGLWLHGVVHESKIDRRTEFGNNGWHNNHLVFHKDVRNGLLHTVPHFEALCEKQWLPDERNTEWIFCSHSHEFQAYNVSQGLAKDARQVVAGASSKNADHFRNQCRYTESVSMKNELLLPDWVQGMLNTAAFHEHWRCKHANF